MGRYVDAVVSEYAMRAAEPGAGAETLYIGGGTPSLLTPEHIQRLLSGLPVPQPGAEVTIEVNPDDVTAAKASAWQGLGINRVSMGVQSFDDSELRAVGRRHTSARARDAYKTLRDAGFKNISIDLIIGLPGQTFASLSASIDSMLALQPEHFSAYMLSYEEGTPLYRRVEQGLLTPSDDDVVADMYTMLCRRAADAGYEHYEVSNFARPGYRAVHNSLYWQNRPYLGLGPGAHSFDGRNRSYNPDDIDSYIQAISCGELVCRVEPETETNCINDMILMGLRTSDGLDLNVFTPSVRAELLRRARRHKAWFLVEDNVVRVPQSQWLMLNSIIVEMLME